MNLEITVARIEEKVTTLLERTDEMHRYTKRLSERVGILENFKSKIIGVSIALGGVGTVIGLVIAAVRLFQ